MRKSSDERLKPMNIPIENYKPAQGDLVFCTMTDKKSGNKPLRGWMLITEVGLHDCIITANFAPMGQTGYGGVMHPMVVAYAVVKGAHGMLSPFAALTQLFDRSTALLLLNTL